MWNQQEYWGKTQFALYANSVNDGQGETWLGTASPMDERVLGVDRKLSRRGRRRSVNTMT